jgi:hypothetical protein
MSLQTTSAGTFRPVGSKSFGKIRQMPEAFDQQPVETAATISACIAASRAEDGMEWAVGAKRAFDWFLGESDLKTTLVDFESGSCSDGLHSDRPNENKGAESVLSYLIGLAEMRQFTRAAAIDRTKSLSGFVRTADRSIAPRTKPGERLAPIPIIEPPTSISASGSGSGGRQTIQASD